ncbi:hypothetical protein ACQ661_11625 [Pseudidiomarina sp. WS423]|uniref:hypothetical protein n=1 Tax=Pseudidiomarina sp. WS423 TaxID=3425124 RepID=UPI003D6E9B15
MWPASRLLIVAVLLAAPVSAQELSDPTAPPVVRSNTNAAGPALAAELKLQAIQWRGTRRTALIGGQRVSVGDTINQYIVRAIDMNQVTLMDSKTNKTVRLALFSNVKLQSGQEQAANSESQP